MNYLFLFNVLISSVFDGENDPPKTQELDLIVKRFGVDDDKLKEYKEGKIKPDDFFKDVSDKIQKDYDARLRNDIIKDQTAQIAKGIYTRKESELIKVFGVDESLLADVDEKNRYSKILEIGLKSQKDRLAELESKYKGADAAKVKQLTEQLEAANQLVSDHPKIIEQLKKEYAEKLVEQENAGIINRATIEIVSAFEDGKLRQSTSNINDLLNVHLQQNGHKLTVLRDENGKIVTKDGKPRIIPVNAETGAAIAIPGTTTNYDYHTYFKAVGDARDFFAKSNGKPGNNSLGGGVIVNDNELKDITKNLPANVVAKLKAEGALQ